MLLQAWLQQPGVAAKKTSKQNDLIHSVDDIKVFKKLIRTHNNVLVVFVKKGITLVLVLMFGLSNLFSDLCVCVCVSK